MAAASASGKMSKAKLESFVSALVRKGIKLLALDFDLTLISIHTGGMWKEGTEKLLCHVRPCMRDLVEYAHNKGLHVCIVTFHRQAWLIRELLQYMLPKKIASKVLVQASTKEMLQQQRQNTDGLSEVLGKEAHIAAVVNELATQHGVTIKSEEIILLDDDVDNVRTAAQFGHFAFKVMKDVNYDSFENFQKMLL